MNIGSIYNMNNMLPAGRVTSPVPRQPSPLAAPAVPSAGSFVSPAGAFLPSAGPYTQGSSALFFSPDGDSAEISLRAKGLSLIEPAARPALPGTGDPSDPGQVENDMLKALETQRVCHTCENRRYVDQSNDSSVSFQTPTKVSPSMAAAAVASHEQEHVRNEQAKADRDDREIVSQTVTLTYDTCPECGKQYVSGGTTKTT